MKFHALIIPLGALLYLASTQPALRPHRTADAPPAPPPLPLSTGIDQTLKIPVTPDALLAVWTLEPAAGTPVRGTVLFLHGFGTSHNSVTNAAQAVRRAGYRAVLVDMRGFGQSTGVHTDFGVTDARDMTQLIDALQIKNLCGPTLGVYGTSLGAATAILFAADDPRVTTVVAVAPFADIRTEVPSFARGVLGSLANVIADQDLNRVANLVGKAARWDLDNAKPLVAITKTKAQILLIHGDADDFVPHAASEELHAAAPDHSVLITPHDRGHVDLCFDLPGELQGVTRQWFDAHLMPQEGRHP